jgi:DNA helicase HerA-like ATPase
VKRLAISESLSLPLNVATQAVAIFGIRGGGKTNTAGVIAEELLRAGVPIAVIDPTDAWWGLRSSRDGQSEGFSVFIFGGSHGDLPLEEGDGKAIAEFVVSEQVPVILSLRHLRKGAQRRFVTEFCGELYHLKGKPENRSPLTVFIDEAPTFVPQKVFGDAALVVGAVEDLVSKGRISGFGVVLIAQRPATLNADVRSLCDTIITHRITGKLDRTAFAGWIEENATVTEMGGVLSSLAKLQDGEAWVWAPVLDIMKRVQIRIRDSYDSSKTPKLGEKIRPPKRLAEIDREKLKARLSASIEKARADDPKELRKTITALQKQLSAKPAAAPNSADLSRARAEGKRESDAAWKATNAARDAAMREDRSRFDRLRRLLAKVVPVFSDIAKELAVELPDAPKGTVPVCRGSCNK